ncbi:cell division protein [Bacteroidia bacterium]|nr:cell division protein [Bacteroidia bacterium]
MKVKIYLWGLAAVALLASSSCKPKQNAYAQVYEVAKAKPIVYTEPVVSEPENSGVEEIAAVAEEDERPIVTRIPQQPAVASVQTEPEPAASTNFRKEQLTSSDGGSILRYSVVIGSFVIKANASSLQKKMQNEGYRPVLAQNAEGLYRLLLASFSDRASAVAEKERIKNRFNDAWLLEQDL